MTASKKRNGDANGSPGAGEHPVVSDQIQNILAASTARFSDTANSPETTRLFNAAREAMERAAPKSFVHDGQTYWLRVLTPTSCLMVYASEDAFVPMAIGLLGTTRYYGHKPKA